MVQQFSLRRLFHLVRRESADHYLFVVFLGFAGSVSLTRLFLSLTNYPRIEGGELHIAHALWGGLLLFIAFLLPLVLANKRAFSASALTGGIGVGLFIDEVGKFITKSNDYFFPAAASIVYTFLLLSILLFIRYRRAPHKEDHAELSRALEVVQQSLQDPLTPHAHAVLEERLMHIIQEHEEGPFEGLAQNLLLFTRQDERRAAEKKGSRFQLALLKATGWISTSRLKGTLVVCLAGLGLISFKNPIGFLLERWAGHPAWLDSILYFTAGRHIEDVAAPELANVRMVLEMCVGTLFLSAAVLLILRLDRQAIYLALTALLITFTSSNIIVFYFEQFSTLIMVGVQFAALFGLLEYRRRLNVPMKGIPID